VEFVVLRVIKPLIIVCLVIVITACAGKPSDAAINRDTDQQTTIGDGTRSPLDPIPGEENMSRGSLVIRESHLQIMESYPLQIALDIQGELPSPCHQLRAEVSEPDDQGRIQVELYSLSDPEVICIQVLEPFETNLSLGSYPDGSYTVWLNGELVGEFSQG
jgi:hypothetical protein